MRNWPVSWQLLVGFLLLLVSWLIFSKRSRPSPVVIRAQIPDLIRTGLEGSGYALLSKYIIAQAKHETGNFTDHKVVDNYNLFGMKYPEIRPTTATGKDANGYAKYNSIYGSVQDLVEWFKYNEFPKAVIMVDHYVHELKKRNYFTAREMEYLNGMRRFL